MQDANIVMGALIAGMTYLVARRLIASRGAAFVVAALIALHPAMFLFEANRFCTLPVTFLAVSSVFALTRLRAAKPLR